MKRGVLKSWHEQGWGLIRVSRSEFYFLHETGIVTGPDAPVAGMVVSFDTAEPLSGGKYPRALNAVVEEKGGAVQL